AEDLGSSNGTFVNEARIQKQALNHADVVRCGTLQVRFVEVADAKPAGQKPKTMSIDLNAGAAPGASGVQVDPSLTGDTAAGLSGPQLLAMKDQELVNTSAERDALAARLREAAKELELARTRQETDEGEVRKLRTELVAHRDKAAELAREKSQTDEELH